MPYDSTFSRNNFHILDIKLQGAERKVNLTEGDNIIISWQKDDFNLLLPRTYSLQDYFELKRQRELDNNFKIGRASCRERVYCEV